MQRYLVASRGTRIRLLGPSWKAARAKLLELINEGNQLVILVGRAGVGKTTLLLSLGELDDSILLYVDMTETNDRGLPGLVSSMILSNAETISTIQKRLREAKPSGILRSFYKASLWDIVEGARINPMEILRIMNDAVQYIGVNKLIIGIDEGVVSQDDPRLSSFIDMMHSFRNNMGRLSRTVMVVTMLPDVVDTISKVDTPLFDVMRMSSVVLPDYVGPGDMEEIAANLGLSKHEVERIMKLGPLTMRQLMCIVMTRDPVRCGVEHGEVTIEP